MSETCGDNGGVNNSGEPCGRVAGHGTDHKGEGRCKAHEVDMMEKYEIDLEEVEFLAGSGVPIDSDQAPDVLDYYGISQGTWHNICEKNPEVREAYKRAKTQASANVGKSLFQKAKNGDTQSMKFYLKCQAGWKPTEKREITGEDGGEIETNVKIYLPDNERD